MALFGRAQRDLHRPGQPDTGRQQDWGGPFNDSLTGAAYGISQSGDAVGVLAFQNEPYLPAGMHAFFYSAAGNTVVDLNTVVDGARCLPTCSC